MFLQDEKKKKKLKVKKVKYGRIYVWDPNIIPYEGEREHHFLLETVLLILQADIAVGSFVSV